MLQALLSFLGKTKTAYLAVRENNPVMITGDFDLKFHLHRKNTPDQATNASADGKISVALIDIAMIGAILSAAAVVAGAFALAGHIVRRLFD